jgi:hypothetical protein
MGTACGRQPVTQLGYMAFTLPLLYRQRRDLKLPVTETVACILGRKESRVVSGLNTRAVPVSAKR